MLGIRREDKHAWERRVPLTPDHVRSLTAGGVSVTVQPSPLRAFVDDDYAAAGAVVQEDLSACGVVLGVKEMPIAFLKGAAPRTLFAFFSHTIKGQPANMPMLRCLMERRAHLLDHERIVDDAGRRLVFFGHYAGVAGMIDALWALGQRLQHDGIATPLARVEPAHRYHDLPEARASLRDVAAEVQRDGWPPEAGPVVVGFAGYGNVSRGAQEVFAELKPDEIAVDQLAAWTPGRTPFAQVVFREEHLVEPREGHFELQDYYQHPERYRSIFRRHLPHLSVLVNAIYWDDRYPRLIARETLRDDWPDLRGRLRVIADITCDVEGAIECTTKATDPGNPVYVFEPASGVVRDGFAGDGPVILAVDTLPCELPRESSTAFGDMLAPLIPGLLETDLAHPDHAGLPAPLRRATILWNGRLTPDYRYLEEHL